MEVKGKGKRERERRERKRESAATSSGEGQGKRECRLEEVEDLLALAEGGMGMTCLLKKQGNQLTGEIIRI